MSQIKTQVFIISIFVVIGFYYTMVITCILTGEIEKKHRLLSLIPFWYWCKLLIDKGF